MDRSADKLKYFKGSLLAGAVGDALGYAVEFDRYSVITRKYGAKGIRSYESEEGKAVISDDTQMTLFTANGLLYWDTASSLRGVASSPSAYVYLAYLDWLTTQGFAKPYKTRNVCWLLNVPELFHPRAPGGTCLSSLSSGKAGSVEKPINESKGCGAVMRIAPFGLFFGSLLKRSPKKFLCESMEIGAITHGNPMSHLSCALASAIIADIIYGECESIEKATKDSLSLVGEFTSFSVFEEFSKLIERALELSKNDRPDEENIRVLGEGWVAEEAIAIAVYCSCKYQNDLTEGIIAAVNHNGDSDSTGAITGNILGAWNGVDAIPEEYLKDLELVDVIEEIATDLSTGCPMKNDGDYDADWGEKYIKLKRRDD